MIKHSNLDLLLLIRIVYLANTVSIHGVAYISGVIIAYSNKLHIAGSWYFNNSFNKPNDDRKEKNSSS